MTWRRQNSIAGILAIAASQPRTYAGVRVSGTDAGALCLPQRLFNFPDLIVAQVAAASPEASTLVLYSRSVYGYGDFGVNRARVVTWLAALDRTLNPAKER